MKTFSRSLVELLSHPSVIKLNPKLFVFLLDLYESKSNFWNMGLIGLIGVMINQFALHFFLAYVPLWIANFFGIILAWSWNYHNCFGKLSKYWGWK